MRATAPLDITRCCRLGRHTWSQPSFFFCRLIPQGNLTLIEAALRHGVKKFVLVTSIGTGAGLPPAHSQFMPLCTGRLLRQGMELAGG